MARVALQWVVSRPGVTTTLMGVSRPEQVTDNIAALDVDLTAEHHAQLDAVSAGDRRMLYTLFEPPMRQHAVFGGTTVRAWYE
jgi:aryl-alcohol dehydrogenase-like predicted oxidoreductase